MTLLVKEVKLLAELNSLLGNKVEIVAVRGRLTGVITEVQPKYLVLNTALSRVILMLDQIIFVRQTLSTASTSVEQAESENIPSPGASQAAPVGNTAQPTADQLPKISLENVKVNSVTKTEIQATASPWTKPGTKASPKPASGSDSKAAPKPAIVSNSKAAPNKPQHVTNNLERIAENRRNFLSKKVTKKTT